MSLVSLAGCQRPNPAFNGASLVGSSGDGDGDSDATDSQGSETSETDTEAPETDTEAPETDTEAPETDTEAPETDTEEPETDTEEPPGDGDGDEACYVEYYEPAADTFFQGGPNTQQGCELGWNGPWVNGNCQELNFGSTAEHWVGLKSVNLNNSEGASFYVFAPPELDPPPGFEPVYIEVVIFAHLLEPGMPGGKLRLQTIIGSENSSWYAGNLDGVVAQSGSLASTYGYRIPENAPWPEGAFHFSLDELVVELPVGGVQGLEAFPLVFDAGLVEDIALNPGKFDNGFALTSVGLDGYDVLVNSLEAEPDLRPFFVVEWCPV